MAGSNVEERREDLEKIQTKLDRALLFVQGVKDLPTIKQVMNVMEILPGVGLDENDRRALTRALIGYLNDPNVISTEENIEMKLDMINNLCGNYYARVRETKLRAQREMIRGDTRTRTEDQRVSIAGIGPHNAELVGATAAETAIAPQSDFFGVGDELSTGIESMMPPMLRDTRVGGVLGVQNYYGGSEFGNYGHEGLPEGELPENGVFEVVDDAYLRQVTPQVSPVRPPHPLVPPTAVRSPYPRPQIFASPVRALRPQIVAPAVVRVSTPLAQQIQINHQPQLGMGQLHAQPRRPAPQLAHPFVRAPAPVIPVPVQVQAHVPAPFPVNYGPVAAPVPVQVPDHVPAPFPANYGPVAAPVPVQVQAHVPAPFPANYGPVAAPVPVQVQAHVPAPVPVYAPVPAPFQAPRPAAFPGYLPQAPAPVPAVGYHHCGGRLREYKFNGKIVDPGEADGITYGSLMYQIESAQQQGYSDVEIGAAIIRATKSSSLRSVLEARPGARIADLVPSLKAHFTVKGVNAVFNELCRGTQGTNETALQFCQRMIGVRSLVSRMNNEEGQKFTPDLIQTQFQYSISTGIRGEIRHVLRGMLKVPNVDDNLLMKEITDLMLSETEHEEKGEKKKTTSVNIVETTEANKDNKKNKNPLLTEVNKISTQIQNLSTIQPQLDNLRKDMKRQERAFSGLYCGMTPQQKQIIASEYPELPNIANQAPVNMYPPTVPVNNYSNPVNNYQVPAIYSFQNSPTPNHTGQAAYTCVVDPNLVDYGQGLGYDPQSNVYRGGYSNHRGGYAGGGLGRGNFQHRGGSYSGGGNRGGGRNYQIRGGNTRGRGGGQNRGGQQSGNVPGHTINSPAAVVNNNGVNAAADPSTQNSLNMPVQGGQVQGNVSSRGSFGGGGGLSNRGGHHGFQYQFQGSQNFRCHNCVASNTWFCSHCFRCGGGGHRSADCPSLN